VARIGSTARRQPAQQEKEENVKSQREKDRALDRNGLPTGRLKVSFEFRDLELGDSSGGRRKRERIAPALSGGRERA